MIWMSGESVEADWSCAVTADTTIPLTIDPAASIAQ
jgi:hypothetical protein